MNTPTHQPAPAPTKNTSAMGGMAFTNQSSPNQSTPIMAAKRTSVRPCQKIVGGIMGRRSERLAWPHPIDTRHGKEAA